MTCSPHRHVAHSGCCGDKVHHAGIGIGAGVDVGLERTYKKKSGYEGYDRNYAKKSGYNRDYYEDHPGFGIGAGIGIGLERTYKKKKSPNAWIKFLHANGQKGL